MSTCKISIYKVITLVIFLTSMVCGIASADLDAQEKALKIIADFADRLCNKVPLEGSSDNLELSGSAKVELNELIERIAGLKIEGAGKYLSTEYQGVLQKDLAGLLKSGAECKLQVFKDLKDKLIPTSSQTQSSTSTSDAIGSSYEIECRDDKEGNIFSAIIQMTSAHEARWRYANATSWNESLRVENLSPRRFLLTSDKNDPSQQTWDLEFVLDYQKVKGTYRFLQNAPLPSRWRYYLVTGSMIK
jgi:hypothetical protein